MQRLLALSEHPMVKRLIPLLYGLIASILVIWLGRNNWIEATTRAAALIMGVTAILGGIITRKDGLKYYLAWFLELLPSVVVVLYAQHVGQGADGRQDHMGVMALYLGIILLAPFVGSSIRFILSPQQE